MYTYVPTIFNQVMQQWGVLFRQISRNLYIQIGVTRFIESFNQKYSFPPKYPERTSLK